MARQHNGCLDCCLSFFFPPVAILVHSGDCGGHFWLNICLCFFTIGVGAIIHALWFCFCRIEDDNCGGPNININLNNQTNVGGASTVVNAAPAPMFNNAPPMNYGPPQPGMQYGAPYGAPPPQGQYPPPPGPPNYPGDGKF
ncbi:hypothetical protein L596_015502 [Steinernema carpocapsae]|uniref:Uncharacterized protein n=1 Tax=Steinernema carpocapsae TaxID=34508 RepID=A0A4U5NF74_STECR|nr:hypothetical protein L596_015502 [Steinernema carpocapsae]